jgi:heme oxygenase-like protein
MTHPHVRGLLPEYLIRSHCIIRASVPLMETARDRARTIAPDDPVAAGVVDYLDGHIDEERCHDEWLLDDLEVMGVDRTTVLARVPSSIVASLVGSQYYWVLHFHPVVVLGYIAVMEGYPPTPRLIEGLIARTGYPRNAFRTLIQHGELDPHHRDELNRMIDALAMTRTQEAALGVSAMSSVDLLARSVREVVDVFQDE